jgi:hypothetical protein
VGLFGVAMDVREALAVDSSSDAELVNVSSRRRRTIIVTLVGGVALLVAIVALSRSSYALSSQHVEDATEEFAQADVDEDQPNWQMVQQERDLCSKPKEDCLKTQCCKTSGYKCYKQPAGNVGKCMRYCKKKGCTLVDKMVHLQVEAPNGILAPAETMFCFSVYTQNTGSTKKSTEKELLTEQHKRQVSIFACNAFAVYSDVAVDLGGGTSTIKVSDVDGDFHFAKRKSTGAWVNTGMFKQVWKTIDSAGTYKKYDWTVKADPDAVFVPSRLVSRIRMLPRPSTGIFLVNCKHVDNGFFGNLEVFSSYAFSVLANNIDTCNTQIPWKVGVKDGKNGPMGEDLFAEKCMEKHGVAKVEAFDISIDGACPADRPGNLREYKHWHGNCKDVVSAAAIHPFKKVTEYFQCLDDTVAAGRKVW